MNEAMTVVSITNGDEQGLVANAYTSSRATEATATDTTVVDSSLVVPKVPVSPVILLSDSDSDNNIGLPLSSASPSTSTPGCVVDTLQLSVKGHRYTLTYKSLFNETGTDLPQGALRRSKMAVMGSMGGVKRVMAVVQHEDIISDEVILTTCCFVNLLIV